MVLEKLLQEAQLLIQQKLEDAIQDSTTRREVLDMEKKNEDMVWHQLRCHSNHEIRLGDSKR